MSHTASSDASTPDHHTIHIPDDRPSIPALVQQLGTGTDAVRYDAVATLSTLATGGPANQAAIADAGGIPALVRLLGTSTSEAVRYEAVATLNTLAAGSDAGAEAMAEAGCVPAMVRLLFGESNSVSNRAAEALSTLARNRRSAAAVADDAGVIPALARLLASVPYGSGARRHVAKALRGLAASTRTMDGSLRAMQQAQTAEMSLEHLIYQSAKAKELVDAVKSRLGPPGALGCHVLDFHALDFRSLHR